LLSFQTLLGILRTMHTCLRLHASPPRSGGQEAFTRLELTVIVGSLAMLAVVAFPLMGSNTASTERALFSNNIR
jgi:hypothetical protein